MFSSTEMAVAWIHNVLDVKSCTYAPRDDMGNLTTRKPFCIVERTGGELDYPHDSPEITFQFWAQEEITAEELANMAAIACKTMPPEDHHVNGIGVPSILSYGQEEGGWFVWETTVTFNCNLLD